MNEIKQANKIIITTNSFIIQYTLHIFFNFSNYLFTHLSTHIIFSLSSILLPFFLSSSTSRHLSTSTPCRHTQTEWWGDATHSQSRSFTHSFTHTRQTDKQTNKQTNIYSFTHSFTHTSPPAAGRRWHCTGGECV